jgi:hypothetical protein
MRVEVGANMRMEVGTSLSVEMGEDRVKRGRGGSNGGDESDRDGS